MHFIARREGRIEGGDRARIDEDANVRANALLLIDHSKAHPRVHALEIGEQRGEGRAAGADLRGAMSVGAQRAGYFHIVMQECSARPAAYTAWVTE